VVKYPFHTALVVLAMAGILLTSFYDDLIYPVDSGLISIGFVLLFAVALGTLIARAKRAERAAPGGPEPPPGPRP
jgi:hypothetical protein